MYDLFAGWRRKAGMVTLMIALGLMTLWMRSHICSDLGYLTAGCSFGSSRGGAFWIGPSEQCRTWSWDTIPESEFEGNLAGMSLAQMLEDELESRCLYSYIMYWRLVFPLALLSAYLLFWKPPTQACVVQ